MQVNEGLKAGDLEGIVEKRFSVDQYKSKMGEDKDICVLAFVCSGAAGAKDLENFAEKGYKKVLEDFTPKEIEMLFQQSPWFGSTKSTLVFLSRINFLIPKIPKSELRFNTC